MEEDASDACFQNVACTSLGLAFVIDRRGKCRSEPFVRMLSDLYPVPSSFWPASQHSSFGSGSSAVLWPSLLVYIVMLGGARIFSSTRDWHMQWMTTNL